MDIKELNKTQLILLTLLITFVVSIATGIVTVSLMQQMPKSVPQTINNVIQRTIEKVTTVPAPVVATDTNKTQAEPSLLGDGDVIVAIYAADGATAPVKPDTSTVPSTDTTTKPVDTTKPTDTKDTKPDDTKPADIKSDEPKALGNGIIISDVGLILVDSSILTGDKVYKVILNKVNFDATVIQKFGNGFSILKITPQKEKAKEVTAVTPEKTDKSDLSAQAANAVDNKR